MKLLGFLISQISILILTITSYAWEDDPNRNPTKCESNSKYLT